MDSLQAAEQHSRIVYSALTDSELDFLAYPRDYTTQIYDVSGVLLGVVKPDEMVIWKCEACTKKFASKQSLERHHERFPLCKNWSGGPDAAPTVAVHTWASRLIENAISIYDEDDGIQCKFCESRFSNTGNLHKHFNSAVTCNRLAYAAVKEAFKS